MSEFDTDHLKLTDFMDLPTLQEIQDNFAAIANVRAIITDADGRVLTQAQPTREFLQRQRALAAAEESRPAPQKEGAEYVAHFEQAGIVRAMGVRNLLGKPGKARQRLSP